MIEIERVAQTTSTTSTWRFGSSGPTFTVTGKNQNPMGVNDPDNNSDCARLLFNSDYPCLLADKICSAVLPAFLCEIR